MFTFADICDADEISAAAPKAMLVDGIIETSHSRNVALLPLDIHNSFHMGTVSSVSEDSPPLQSGGG